MFRSTAVLIEARSPYCIHKPDVVPVLRMPVGKPNACLDNAADFCDAHRGSVMVSGWLAHEYDATGTADFIQHWWNFHDGQHIDTTPQVGDSNCEYVLDAGLYAFAVRNYDRLWSLVASSLILEGQEFQIAVRVEACHVISVPTIQLDCATLYSRSML